MKQVFLFRKKVVPVILLLLIQSGIFALLPTPPGQFDNIVYSGNTIVCALISDLSKSPNFETQLLP